jgi:hypothetical protein
LTTLWSLLEAAKEKNLTKLQVFGDSKMAIDWANGKSTIQNPNLASILQDIKLSFRAFERISFHHILRELNSKVDELSKKPWNCQMGPLDFMSSWTEQIKIRNKIKQINYTNYIQKKLGKMRPSFHMGQGSTLVRVLHLGTKNRNIRYIM